MREKPKAHFNDGTSQADRVQKALVPEYILVDERETRDLLRFARAYSKTLRFFNEKNEEDGDWSAFLDAVDPDEVAAHLDRAGGASDDAVQNERLSRPHLVLFLAFLDLLKHARTQMNQLTRRHLDFYYREALGLTSRGGAPDQVHVVVKPAKDQAQFLLPAGTLFQAGRDSRGADIVYRSDADLLVNQAEVSELKSLFVSKQVVGLAEAARRPDILIDLFPAHKAILEQGTPRDRAFMAMLIMAFGEPGPGGALALFPDGRDVNARLHAALDSVLGFIPASLYLSIGDFRLLMALKDAQAETEDAWNRVNDVLETAGKRRDARFKLDRSEPQNFEKNLLSALGRQAFGDMFNGLPEVENIYDLYRRRDRADAAAFISHDLFMTMEAFTTMMGIVSEIHDRWRSIFEILRAAGREKQKTHPEHTIQSPRIRAFEKNKFEALVACALGKIDFSKIEGANINSFDDIHDEVSRLEGYYYMSAEQFVSIRKLNAGKEDAETWEWDRVYASFEEAHRRKAVSRRRQTLKQLRETKSVSEMLLFALGDPNPGDALKGARDFSALDPEADKSYIVDALHMAIESFKHIKLTIAKGNGATAAEWDKVYAILEEAERTKRGLDDPRVEIENFENLYAAADATSVRVSVGAPDESATPRFKTFGEGYVSGAKRQTVPGRIGFAVASPLLLLAEGRRTITLTLEFGEAHFDENAVRQAIEAAPGPFRFLLSGDKGMVEAHDVTTTLRIEPSDTSEEEDKPNRYALDIVLFLDEQAPPLTPVTSGGADIETPWPVLQLILADIDEDKTQTAKTSSGPRKRYTAFQKLSLSRIHLKVAVDGIAKPMIQNDDSLLDAKKPFEPFGASPVAGSRFYLAHEELCVKKLDTLSLGLDWLGVPDNLHAYYMGYDHYLDPNAKPASPIENNAAFNIRLGLYDNRLLFKVGDFPLFNADDDPTTGAAKSHQIVVEKETMASFYPAYDSITAPVSDREVLGWRRYWQMELLAPDFQHSVYPQAAAGCAGKMENGAPKPVVINPPYTPKIKTLRVGYTASSTVDVAGRTRDRGACRLYHLEPFGYSDPTRSNETCCPFLPQYDHAGELFIGIENLAPPEQLSLLFQMAEGSADPDLEREPIAWCFLNGDTWQSLEQGQLLSDTTNGLVNSGIVKLMLPEAARGTVLPGNRYWIRAGIKKNCASVAHTVAIKAQAVTAVFQDHDNAPDHLARPLAAESISSLVEARGEVKRIHQPYSSFGGSPKEQPGSFYTRVSERLRHKSRALSCWDYERMILEAFPEIYKVKCLPVGISDDPEWRDVVRIVVIPDIRGKLPFDPFEPKAPADTLLEIERYMARHAPPLVTIKVQNPRYIRLKVRLGVALREGANPGYYKNLLNDELARFLSPWAYDSSAEIFFGGKINTNLIVNFVDERPYVDYTAGIKLFTLLDDRPVSSDGDWSVLAPDAILVSDRSHIIDLIEDEVYQEALFTGIGYMKIAYDFHVAQE